MEIFGENRESASGKGASGNQKATGSFDLVTANPSDFNTTAKSLSADITKTSGSLTLTLSANATGVGTTTGKCEAWKYAANKGTCIKKQAMKLTGLTAGTTLTIVAYQNSTTDRNLEVTVGTSGTTETTAMGTTSGATKTYTKALTSTDDVYIGASNEIYIQKITVE